MAVITDASLIERSMQVVCVFEECCGIFSLASSIAMINENNVVVVISISSSVLVDKTGEATIGAETVKRGRMVRGETVAEEISMIGFEDLADNALFSFSNNSDCSMWETFSFSLKV